MKGLTLLTKQVGEASAQHFLRLVQNQVTQDHQELLHHLHEKQWQQAADKAHYLKATANIYASERLIKYYVSIMKNQSTLEQDTLLVNALRQELKRVENNIQYFLDDLRTEEL